MKILGIETSCDETAAAVVESPPAEAGPLRVLSNIVASSAEMHSKTGGVIPEVAARQQIKSIVPVVKEAIEASFQNPSSIDAIAVTIGPGLIGSLLIGVETAKTLACVWKKPIVPVNHLVGHIYANWLEADVPEFPALALVVSGGHTDLVLIKGHGELRWIGGTRDDAAGEAFDKTARLLGLPYPGGPALSQEAEKFKSKNPKSRLDIFPRPLVNQDNFDWSFSGLKTAVLRRIQSDPDALKTNRAELAAQIQEAIVDCLVIKSIKAVKRFKPRSFLLAGGVAANDLFRITIGESLSELDRVRPHVPEIKYCTDNAAYIAAAAYYNYKPIDWKNLQVNPNLTIAD